MRILLQVLVAVVFGAGGLTAQDAPRWTAQRELRIGAVEGAPEYLLTQPGAVLADRDGRIYVSQPREQTIRVYDAAGRFVRALGRRGAGPGEFEGLSTIGWRGDTLFASDVRTRTVTLFSAEGTYIATLRPEFPAIMPPPAATREPPRYLSSAPHILLRDGTALMRPGVAVAALSAGTVTKVPLLRVQRAGGTGDTLLWLPLATEQGRHVTLGGRPFSAPEPFPAGLLAAYSEDGIVAVERGVAGDAREGFFRVLWLAPNGDTTLARRYRYTPRALTRAHADSAIAAVTSRYRVTAERLGVAPSELERVVRSSVTMPRFHPPITAVRLAANGEVWLRREELPGETVQWFVLSATGDVLGGVALPKRMRVHSIVGDRVYGWETDELDVPYVLQYRVNRRT